MIKGHGFLKSLKRSLIGFGISCFMVLGGSFVNADDLPSGNDLPYNFYTQDILNIISKDLNFSNSNGGNWLDMKAGGSSDGHYNVFWVSGKLYNYGYYKYRSDYSQGFFSQACKVYSLTGNLTFPNCSDSSEWSVSNLEEFYNLTGYNFTRSVVIVGNDTASPKLCFYNSNNYYYYCFEREYTDNSLGIIRNETDFSQYAGQSPFGAGGSSVGPEIGNIDNNLTGDYIYGQCTWNDIKIILESEGYNKYLCYGGLDNFDLYDSSLNYNPIPGAGKSIGDIWAWSGSRAWDNFQQWFTFWYGLYIDDSNNYNAMWESYPAVYHTYFQLFDIYKGSVEPRTVLEYCNLLNFDSSVMNNNAGGYFKPTCDTVIREKQTGLWESRLDGTIYSGGIYTGNVPISVNWSGVGNMSGSNVQDSMNFLQNFFNLAKSKINTNYGGGAGALPSYIIVFLLAIILFRFLSH